MGTRPESKTNTLAEDLFAQSQKTELPENYAASEPETTERTKLEDLHNYQKTMQRQNQRPPREPSLRIYTITRKICTARTRDHRENLRIYKVFTELRQWKNGKAPGPDGISNELLKLTPRSIACRCLTRLHSRPSALLVYVNDITNDPECEMHLYADDAILMAEYTNDPTRCFEKINNDLQRLDDWAKQWCMSFNPTKTKYVVVTTTPKQHHDLYLNGDVEFYWKGQ